MRVEPWSGLLISGWLVFDRRPSGLPYPHPRSRGARCETPDIPIRDRPPALARVGSCASPIRRGIGAVEHLPRELRAALDAQRPEEACQMRLDGVDAHEQRVGDLLVRPTGGYEVDDLPLRRRERSALGPLGGDALELGSCALQPQPRTQPLEDRDRLGQGLAVPAISGGRGAGSRRRSTTLAHGSSACRSMRSPRQRRPTRHVRARRRPPRQGGSPRRGRPRPLSHRIPVARSRGRKVSATARASVMRPRATCVSIARAATWHDHRWP